MASSPLWKFYVAALGYWGHANNDDDDDVDADVHESFKSDQTNRMEIAQDPSIEMRKLYIY